MVDSTDRSSERARQVDAVVERVRAVCRTWAAAPLTPERRRQVLQQLAFDLQRSVQDGDLSLLRERLRRLPACDVADYWTFTAVEIAALPGMDADGRVRAAASGALLLSRGAERFPSVDPRDLLAAFDHEDLLRATLHLQERVVVELDAPGAIIRAMSLLSDAHSSCS